MPVIQIQSLPQRPGVSVREVQARVTSAAAAAFGCEPGQVWSTWTMIAPDAYVEGDAVAGVQPTGTHPPIARVIAYEGRDDRVIESVLIAVAHALADGLGIDRGSPFVLYDEARSGRVYTGGSVRRTGV